MVKNTLNQNANYRQKLIDIIEPDFNFSNKPINRSKVVKNNNNDNKSNKSQLLFELKKK